ncbi:MAG: preprotein translocase subunit SecE [Clostridia bacterium]|nr:preprotein translocase subunit SecE [Clostridia bacterium]
MAKEKNNKVKNENKRFMKDVKGELKRVTWPTSKQMVSNVTAVIAIVAVTVAIVFFLDMVFGAMDKYGLEKLKQHVRPNEQSQTQVIDNTETDQQEGNPEEQTDDNEEGTANTESENTEGSKDIEDTENTESADNTENTENTENVN